MTIIQLEYLLAVANCGSFSLAAEHCFVTQPSLSMQIKSLEEELGVVLLDRSKKPVIATEAGEVVLERARETLRAYENIRESVAELKGEVAGRLRLGVIPTIAPYLLPRFLLIPFLLIPFLLTPFLLIQILLLLSHRESLLPSLFSASCRVLLPAFICFFFLSPSFQLRKFMIQ